MKQLDFRVLGPLEVRVGGRSLPLGGMQQRSLLALLLLHPNEVVPTDRLVDSLWGETPPPTANTTVQVYVSRLRKTLGADRIETRPPGYMLHLDPGSLDVARFERLRHCAATEADPAEAVALLDEALGLWRGRPLADFVYERFAQPEISRLEELRLVALETRFDALLALGRHADAVAELEALCEEHPFREGLRGQLMVALYRSGRQSDALETYR